MVEPGGVGCVVCFLLLSYRWWAYAWMEGLGCEVTSRWRGGLGVGVSRDHMRNTFGWDCGVGALGWFVLYLFCMRNWLGWGLGFAVKGLRLALPACT